MQTTIIIDDEVFRAATRAAEQTGRTLSAVVELALREALREPAEASGTASFTVSSASGGLREGVSPGRLAEALDGADADWWREKQARAHS